MSSGNRNRNRRRGSYGRRGEKPYEPPRISTEVAWEESVERAPLFYIDDEEFTIPANLPPARGMRYLRNIGAGMREDQAMALLLQEAIGDRAFDALCECDEIDDDSMAKIVDRVLEIALGGTAGKSSRGPAS